MKSPSYTTIEEMNRVILESVLPRVPASVTKVVAIPRSGLLPAATVSFARHIRMGVLGLGNVPGGERMDKCAPPDDGDVLLIDDTVSRGVHMAKAAESLRAAGRSVITACAFLGKGDESKVDLFGDYRNLPRLFEWNLFNHGLGPRIMFDMDGVFCEDPSMWDDDSEEFGRHLSGLRPLRLSRWPIGTICTNRIERWRGVTEEWLSRHGVRYRELRMYPAATAVERRQNQMDHKVSSYLRSDAVMFVESSKAQAMAIADMTSRPVISLEDNTMYGGEG